MARGYPKDPGLVVRMVFTMFLLGLVYVGFVVALVAVHLPLVTVLVIVLAFGVAQLFFADRLALAAMGGSIVSAEEAPDLHGVVERLCALADQPKPRLAISQSDIPNAFATGRSPKTSVLCVTTGLLCRLDPAELEGVLAHELSHVVHRDVVVMTIASFIGIVAGLVTRGAYWAEALGGGGYGRRNNQDQSSGGILLVMLVSAVTYAISFVLIRTLSRYRELAADRSGAILTGRPSALASALVKVSGEMARIPTQDLRAAEHMNAFFFAPALARGFSFSSLVATHPSLKHRLAQLSQLEEDLGKVA